MRIMLESGCSWRVQCRVSSSVSRSAIDQTLKYGSLVTSGTAGGRKAGSSSGGSPPARAVVAAKIRIRDVENHVILRITSFIAPGSKNSRSRPTRRFALFVTTAPRPRRQTLLPKRSRLRRPPVKSSSGPRRRKTLFFKKCLTFPTCRRVFRANASTQRDEALARPAPFDCRGWKSVSRREMLQLGGSLFLGLSLSGLFRPTIESRSARGNVGRAGRPPASPHFRRRPTACILIFLDGGPSHLDMWDMKPDAPAEIRGEFKPIASSPAGRSGQRAPAAVSRGRFTAAP